MREVKSKLSSYAVFVSILSVLLVSSLFIGAFVERVDGQETKHVRTEAALRTEISNAAIGVPVVIILDSEIGLTGSTLAIPANKDITLRSNGNAEYALIGASGANTITVENRGMLSLMGIAVTHVPSAGGSGVVVNAGGTLTMFGGKISGNNGYGVSNNGIFAMTGGAISNNENYGVYSTGGGSNFTLTGGEISSNRYGVYIASGTFNLTNGKISGNTGNGVNIASGAFTMTGGEISNNVRGVDNRGTFIMSGGAISGNEIKDNGGGVWNNGVFTMFGGTISGNTATNGGGVYINNGNFNLEGGRISGNTATNDGGGVWVAIANLDRLSVSAGVVFSDNRAYAAYDRDPIHDSAYRGYIRSNVWTSPFTQGYNNYDISYVYGTSITRYSVTVQDSFAEPSGAGSHPVRGTVTLNAGTRNGYNFARWTVLEGGVTLANSATATFTMPSNNVVIVANWTAIQYSISYTLNGGAATGNPSTYNAGNLPVAIANPVRVGYNFLGWTVRYADGTEATGQIGYSIPTGYYGNIAFTANWGTPNQYPITYVLNGGENAANNPSSYIITDLPRFISYPIRTGYNFQGWTVTYTNGYANIINPTVSYSIPTGATEHITLTANWSPAIAYTITYTLNSGTNAADNPTSYTVESSFPIAIANPTRASYEFLGWTMMYANGTQVGTPVHSYSIPAGTTGNIVLIANWGASTGDSTGSSGGSSNDSSGGSSNSSGGSSSSGSSGSSGQSGGNSVQPAPRGNYTVQFVNWNGSLLKTEIVPYGGDATPPEDPTTEGYIFSGWDGKYTGVTDDMRITALYKPMPRSMEDIMKDVTDAFSIVAGAVAGLYFMLVGWIMSLLGL